MNRSLSLQTLLSILAGGGLAFFGCLEPDQPKTQPAEPISELSQAVHNFCGNGRCDHGDCEDDETTAKHGVVGSYGLSDIRPTRSAVEFEC